MLNQNNEMECAKGGAESRFARKTLLVSTAVGFTLLRHE